MSSWELADKAIKAIQDVDVIFAEVPIGSQSSRAMASYGVCIGVLGALKALNYPVIQVTPNEVKVRTTGSKTASKEEMINWVLTQHPHINFPTKKYKGTDQIIYSKAEHMADAVASIYAGLDTPEFKSYLNQIQGN